MINNLLERLEGLAFPLLMPKELKQRISNISVIRHFEAGDFMLRKGQICSGAYFLGRGLARSYYMKEEKQVTSRLMEEGFIVTSWLSFYRQLPSSECIIAMEKCDTVYIRYEDIHTLYEEFPLFNIIGRKQVEYSFAQAEMRTQMLQGLTGVERYEYFQEKHPSLMERVPLKYIASYLGLSDETLSRIRGRYREKRKLIS